MSQRPFGGARDLAAMVALAAGSPEGNLHRADLPYRLASWALDDPRNVALWVDGRGLLAAWAVLQAPFWTIDFAVSPEAEVDLFAGILDWIETRSRSARGTPHERPSWYVNVFADQADRLRQLERAGFSCQSNTGEDSWSRVLLRREGPRLSAPPPSLSFVVRPLAGPTEVDAYVELHRATFESRNMTPEWRARTLTAAHHVPESDLVAVAPDGRLAGFCIGWLSEGERLIGQVEPLGVAREFRGHGLGAALLSACVAQLEGRGADSVLVETDTYRTPALGLYESLGFRPIRDILVYRKDMPGI